MPTVPELVYFNGRGRAEIIRLTLTAAGIQFTEVDLTSKEQFISLHPDLLFKQVPMLRIDGLKIVQTAAIVRHIGRKANLLGSTDLEKTRVDELYEGSRDMYACFYGWVFDLQEVVEKGIEKNVKKYTPIFNELLSGSASGYLVGDSLTIADLGLLEVVLSMVDYLGLEALKLYPSIEKFYAKMVALEPIQTYIAKVRKTVNDQMYVDTVKLVLAF